MKLFSPRDHFESAIGPILESRCFRKQGKVFRRRLPELLLDQEIEFVGKYSKLQVIVSPTFRLVAKASAQRLRSGTYKPLLSDNLGGIGMFLGVSEAPHISCFDSVGDNLKEWGLRFETILEHTINLLDPILQSPSSIVRFVSSHPYLAHRLEAVKDALHSES